MFKRIMKSSRRVSAVAASAALAATLLTPVATATAAQAAEPGQWNWGRTDISVTTGVVWSRFEHSSRKHGSSARGDKDGLVRSTCKAPGVRAYAESRYSLWGGSSTAYYRYC